jgi:hypothetical protein
VGGEKIVAASAERALPGGGLSEEGGSCANVVAGKVRINAHKNADKLVRITRSLQENWCVLCNLIDEFLP